MSRKEGYVLGWVLGGPGLKVSTPGRVRKQESEAENAGVDAQRPRSRMNGAGAILKV